MAPESEATTSPPGSQSVSHPDSKSGLPLKEYAFTKHVLYLKSHPSLRIRGCFLAWLTQNAGYTSVLKYQHLTNNMKLFGRNEGLLQGNKVDWGQWPPPVVVELRALNIHDKRWSSISLLGAIIFNKGYLCNVQSTG